jgi:hypothetical protein
MTDREQLIPKESQQVIVSFLESHYELSEADMA